MSTSPLDDAGGLNQIGDAAAAAASDAGQISQDERLDRLEQRIANMEPLLEQIQVNSGTGLALGRYVDALLAEQAFFNYARYAVGCVGLLTILLMIGLLGLAVFQRNSPLYVAPAGAIAAFVIGLTSGIVFLLVSFTKGIFRSTAERHADGFLPPALEKAAEAYDKITGK